MSDWRDRITLIFSRWHGDPPTQMHGIKHQKSVRL